MKKLVKRVTAGMLAVTLTAGMTLTAVAEGSATAPGTITDYGRLSGKISSYQAGINSKKVSVYSTLGSDPDKKFSDDTKFNGKSMSIRAIGTVVSYYDTNSVIDTMDSIGTTTCGISITHSEPDMPIVVYGVHQVCDGVTCWATYSSLRDTE